ncbi:MAG: hypothetical protein WDZ28_03780 [Simkaniaceae bacterium]
MKPCLLLLTLLSFEITDLAGSLNLQDQEGVLSSLDRVIENVISYELDPLLQSSAFKPKPQATYPPYLLCYRSPSSSFDPDEIKNFFLSSSQEDFFFFKAPKKELKKQHLIFSQTSNLLLIDLEIQYHVDDVYRFVTYPKKEKNSFSNHSFPSIPFEEMASAYLIDFVLSQIDQTSTLIQLPSLLPAKSSFPFFSSKCARSLLAINIDIQTIESIKERLKLHPEFELLFKSYISPPCLKSPSTKTPSPSFSFDEDKIPPFSSLNLTPYTQKTRLATTLYLTFEAPFSLLIEKEKELPLFVAYLLEDPGKNFPSNPTIEVVSTHTSLTPFRLEEEEPIYLQKPRFLQSKTWAREIVRQVEEHFLKTAMLSLCVQQRKKEEDVRRCRHLLPEKEHQTLDRLSLNNQNRILEEASYPLSLQITETSTLLSPMAIASTVKKASLPSIHSPLFNSLLPHVLELKKKTESSLFLTSCLPKTELKKTLLILSSHLKPPQETSQNVVETLNILSTEPPSLNAIALNPLSKKVPKRTSSILPPPNPLYPVIFLTEAKGIDAFFSPLATTEIMKKTLSFAFSLKVEKSTSSETLQLALEESGHSLQSLEIPSIQSEISLKPSLLAPKAYALAPYLKHEDPSYSLTHVAPKKPAKAPLNPFNHLSTAFDLEFPHIDFNIEESLVLTLYNGHTFIKEGFGVALVTKELVKSLTSEEFFHQEIEKDPLLCHHKSASSPRKEKRKIGTPFIEIEETTSLFSRPLKEIIALFDSEKESEVFSPLTIQARDFSSHSRHQRLNRIYRHLTADYLHFPTLEELSTDSLHNPFEIYVEFVPDTYKNGYLFSCELKLPKAFNYPSEKTHYLFLIDRSKAVEKHRFTLFKNALSRSLSYLKEGDTFNIALFDTKAKYLFSKDQEVNESSLSKAKHFLSNEEHAKLFKTMNLYDLIYEAKEESSYRESLTNVVILTSSTTISDLRTKRSDLKKIMSEKGQDFSLFIATCCNKTARAQQELLCTWNHGEMLYSPTNASFGRKFASLIRRISQPVARNIQLTPIATKETGNITLISSKEFDQPSLYSDNIYKFHGTIENLSDFELFLQGTGQRDYLNITQTISFDKALKVGRGLRSEIAKKEALLYYQSYLEEGDTSYLEKASLITQPYDIELPHQWD